MYLKAFSFLSSAWPVHRYAGMMLYWNYSNPAAGDYVIQSILASVNGSDVDGTFTDDSGGGFPEHGERAMFEYVVLYSWNLSDAPRSLFLELVAGYVASDLGGSMNLTQFYHDSNATYVRLVNALTAAGKTNWQSLSHGRGSGSMSRVLNGLPFRNDSCATWMRGMCALTKEQPKVPLLMSGPCGESEKNGQIRCAHVNQSVAAFLVVSTHNACIQYCSWICETLSSPVAIAKTS